jgi:hypothetical protein
MRQWLMVNRQRLTLFRRVLIIACLLICTSISFSQKISTILDKDKIVIGEQINLKIVIEGIDENAVQKDFNFPDTINHLEILSDSIESEGSSYIHTLTITSFDSGYWQFPSFELLLSDNRKLVTQAVDITVLPADISDMGDYHDIKDILENPVANNWWIVAAIVLVGLLSLFAFLWFVTNKVQEQQEVAVTDLATLYHKVTKEISRLEAADIASPVSMLNVFKETTQITRAFIDTAYQFNTAHLTSGEYMLKMKGKLPDAETENNFFQFLRLADAVKFAKYAPPVDEVRSIFPMLRKVTEQVYGQNKSNS